VAYGYTPDQVRQVYELYQSMPENPNLDLSESLLEHVPEPGPILKRPRGRAGRFCWRTPTQSTARQSNARENDG
jgi:hypothetical protein